MKITIEHHQISKTDGAFNITLGAGGPWETKRSFCYEPDGFSFDEAKSEAQAFHDGACSMFETQYHPNLHFFLRFWRLF